MSLDLTDPMTGDAASSLAQTAYLRLRERLVLLDIAPGAPLNEQALAAELQVGRTPLREAIKRLETEHFVVTFPRRGTFATRVDATSLAEISEVRRALEPVAATRAATVLDEPSRRHLVELREELAAWPAGAGARDNMMMDLRVHLGIYAAAHNSHLESTLAHYIFLSMRVWCLAVRRMPRLGGHITEHQDILDAILDGDAERAATLMRTHLDHFEEALRPVL